jgi:hypothetical protein
MNELGTGNIAGGWDGKQAAGGQETRTACFQSATRYTRFCISAVQQLCNDSSTLPFVRSLPRMFSFHIFGSLSFSLSLLLSAIIATKNKSE